MSVLTPDSGEMTESMRKLLDELSQEAKRSEFPVDVDVYRQSGRDHERPILCAGSLVGPLCIVGRDLGKDEVRSGEPLIGPAGRLVRTGLIQALELDPTLKSTPTSTKPDLTIALKHALLTNTVPFKPIGNKAFDGATRERFRPFLERLLVEHWNGKAVITLGTQAFEWFAPYCDGSDFVTPAEVRFETVFRCKLPGCKDKHHTNGKAMLVYPLPHPSPLNRRWFSRFPAMLASRLREVHAQLAYPHRSPD